MNEETKGIIKDEGVGAVVADDKGKVGKGGKGKAPVKAKPSKAKVGKTVKSAKPVKLSKPVKSATKPTKPAKPIKAGKKAETAEKTNGKNYPRHALNPFRLNSSYAKVFDVFSSFKNGVRRDELLTKVAEAIGKDLKHAAYDLAVILSAKDSNTGSRHRSCAEGFWVKRENDHLTLMID